MKKRVLSLLLVLVMIVSLAPISALAESNVQQIYNYLTGTMGMNSAAACGVLANIERESSFNPHAECVDTNGLTSYGICQWNGDRYTALKNYCSSRGYDYTTLSGQLKYLQYELEGGEAYAYSLIRNVDNSADGAYTAGYNWAQYFERCAQYWDGVDQFAVRAASARDKYWPIYGNGGSSTPSLSVSERTTHEYRVTIPANYILKNYTSETDTNAQSKNYVLARDESYRLACEEKVVLSDGTVRYKWLSGDTPPKTLWFNYDSSIMSVSPKHNYDDYGYEAAHPHKYYYKCSCGDYYYTGGTATVSSCSKCYPAEANVKLYDGYGYSWDSTDVEIGQKYTLPYSYPEKDGYYFCGWSNSRYADDYAYRPGDRIKVESAISLYPVYVSHSKAISGDTVFIYDISDFDATNYNVQKKTVSTDTVVDNSYWTSWSDYSTDRVYESSTVDVRTKLMYRYYYYLCPYCGAHEPFWGTSDCGQTIPSSAWHETWSTVPYSESNYKTFSYTSKKYYTTSLGDGQLWCFSSGNLNDDYAGAVDATGSTCVVETGYSYREYIESYTTKTTSRTGYIITPAHAHSYASSATSPTCTSGGYTTYTCSCGDSYTSSYTDALGHNYANGVCTRCGAKDPNYVPPKVSFTDVNRENYCYDAVQWAVANGITNGTGNNTFSPDKSCSRAEVVTFLWRAAGEPSASATVNFTDVKPTDYFYKAVQWAVENKITTGAGNNTFLPNNICTRSQVVTFLWRANGSPIVSGGGFADVASSAYYCDAVRWAVSEKITTGTGNGQFSPDALCTRGQVVTFLFRAK